MISNSWGAGEYSSETLGRDPVLQPPGRRDHGLVRRRRLRRRVPGRVPVRDRGRRHDADPGREQHLRRARRPGADAGSGCSAYEPKPAWQTDTGCSRRSVADVSADADPNTGAAVYDSVAYSGRSGWFQVGGTSLAAPLIASVYALTGQRGVGHLRLDALRAHRVAARRRRPAATAPAAPPTCARAASGYDGPDRARHAERARCLHAHRGRARLLGRGLPAELRPSRRGRTPRTP